LIFFALVELLLTKNSYKYAKQEFIALTQTEQFKCL